MLRLEKFLSWIEETVIVVLLAVMTTLNFVNVLSRYLLHRSFSWSEELVVMFFVWISMFGIAVAYKRGAHLGMGLITENVPAKIRSFMVLLAMVCSFILIVLIFYYNIDIVRQQIRTDERTPILRWPAYYERLAIPAGCILMAIRTIQSGVREFRKDFFHGGQ